MHYVNHPTLLLYLAIVAINDLVDTKTLIYLLRYDSVYGVYDAKLESGEGFIKINGKNIRV